MLPWVARIKRAMTIFFEKAEMHHLGGPHSRAMTILSIQPKPALRRERNPDAESAQDQRAA
jgi:hypothetical protein